MRPTRSRTAGRDSPDTAPQVRAPVAAIASRLVGPAVFLIGCGAWALMPLDKRSPAWWIGASFFALSGLCFSLLGRRAQSARRPRAAAPPAGQADLSERPSDDPDVLVPMLGVLLAFRYRVINEWQLEKALDIQRKQRKYKQSLGRILLEMGLVTQSQLQRALDYQKEYEQQKRARLRSAAADSAESGAPRSPSAV